MKQLLISILVTLLLMPACGGVFAKDMGHSSMSMVSHQTENLHHGSDHSTWVDHTSEMVESPAMNCCDTNTANPKIGIWEPRTTEKMHSGKAVGTFPTNTLSKFSVRDPVYSYYSQAPPSSSDYSSLVGIIKRLD